MSKFRQLGNLWVLWVTTFVLACFSNAVAQASYRVTDLGAEGKDNLGCAMSVNNEGWTEIMVRNTNPRGGINGTPHGFFFDAKNFLQAVSQFCSGSDISCYAG